MNALEQHLPGTEQSALMVHADDKSQPESCKLRHNNPHNSFFKKRRPQNNFFFCFKFNYR